MMNKESARGSETSSQQQEIRSGDMGKYSAFKDKDKGEVHSLLFDALRVEPFDPVKELVVQLLEVGVPVTLKDKAGSTPLAVAVKQKCPLDVITSLMVCTNLESLLQSQNKHKLTALHEAALVNNYEALQVMINKLQDNHIDINSAAREEQIRSFHYSRLDTTSSCYIIINKKNKEGWTALHYAAYRGHVDVLHVLLMTEQCNLTVCNKNKQTAFHLAAKGGHLLCLQLLFAAVECRGLLESLPLLDKNEWNLACHASAHLKGDVKVMEWLLRNMSDHADINHSAKKGYTPLLLACEYQNIKIVELLLKHDQISELLTTTTDGKTALHLAAIHDSVEIARLLVEKDFPIDETDENGETPLHIAYKKGSHKVLDLLINEANQTIKNKEGKLPEDVKYTDVKVPAEIKKRGEEAVKGYIAALRKGKKKMPRCKLVILGETGVGKTSLLNLLTGEKFVPTHEKTEGVEISLVNTSDIDTKTWKKSAGGRGGDVEHRRAAVTLLASYLIVSSKADDAKDVLPSPRYLYQVFNSVMRHYSEQFTHSKAKRAAGTGSLGSSHSAKRVGDYAPTMQFSDQVAVHEQRTQLPVAKSAEKKDIVHSINQQSVHEQSQSSFAGIATAAATSPIPLPSLSSSSKQEMDTGTDEPQPSSDFTDVPSSGAHNQLYYYTVLRDASRQKSLGSHTLHLKLTSYDFAGEDHYKSMHPCFVTSRAIYIVTFNARELLPDANKDQCIDELKYWVNSILVHTNTAVKIILVGTHRGPYHGTSVSFPVLTEKQISDIDKVLKVNLKKNRGAVFSFFKGDKIMTLVESSIDNNEENSGVKVVREKLLKLGEAHPGNKEELPISYLRLESKIFKERFKRSDTKLFLIPREEVEQWATDCDIEDVEVALDFFHDIGIIVNSSCLPTLFLSEKDAQPLQGIVLIKPQWLADVMKELMKIDRGDEKIENLGEEVSEAIECLVETGKADKKHVLFPLWEEHHNGSEELFEQICLLLEAYGVIIPIKSQNEIHQYYYIPCKLPVPQEVKIPERTDNCHSFHVDFKKGPFPPFVLYQLMFKMYQEYNPKECEFGNNECYMEYIEGCQWWLKQNGYDDIIDVTVRTKPNVRTILPAMQLLDRMLQKILKAKELNKIYYELGPFVHCTHCDKKQSFSYITYTSESSSKRDESLKCCGCKNVFRIGSKYNSETDHIIKSKVYEYEKSFKDFKRDINYDKMDDKLKIHLNEQFHKDLTKDVATVTAGVATFTGGVDAVGDDVHIKRWYECNQKDPWPSVIKFLSCYDCSEDFQIDIDSLKYKFLYLCDHCF